MTQSRKHRGTETRGGLRLPPAHERLSAALTETPSGCLVKTTSLNQKGYSRMTIDGQRVLCHRLAWEVAHGPIPAGRAVCHTCDNPPCCNPDHLFLGSIADNNRDMWDKGRGTISPPKWRKIPPSEHDAIKRRLADGERHQSIAASYGVTRQAINYLAKRWSA